MILSIRFLLLTNGTRIYSIQMLDTSIGEYEWPNGTYWQKSLEERKEIAIEVMDISVAGSLSG